MERQSLIDTDLILALVAENIKLRDDKAKLVQALINAEQALMIGKTSSELVLATLDNDTSIG
jgi:hypothetical protein